MKMHSQFGIVSSADSQKKGASPFSLRPVESSSSTANSTNQKSKNSEEVNIPGRRKTHPTSSKLTCQRCRFNKTKCDGSYPCSRCFRMNYDCKVNVEEEGDGEGEDRGEDVIPLVFARFNPKVVTEEVLKLLHNLHVDKLIDRSKAVTICRQWHLMYLSTGTDTTWGILPFVVKMFDIKPLELDGDQSLQVDAPEHIRRQWAAKKLDVYRRECLALKKENLESSGQAIYLSLLGGDAPHVSCNERFAEIFLGSSELIDHSIQYKTADFLLMSSLFAPSDRILWFQGALALLFMKKEINFSIIQFIKGVNRKGKIGLFILKSSPLVQRGGIFGSVLHFEPAPPSRHLIDRPETQLGTRKPFRRPRILEDILGGGGGESSQSEAPQATPKDSHHPLSPITRRKGVDSTTTTFPALASFPLPGIPSSITIEQQTEEQEEKKGVNQEKERLNSRLYQLFDPDNITQNQSAVLDIVARRAAATTAAAATTTISSTFSGEQEPVPATLAIPPPSAGGCTCGCNGCPFRKAAIAAAKAAEAASSAQMANQNFSPLSEDSTDVPLSSLTRWKSVLELETASEGQTENINSSNVAIEEGFGFNDKLMSSISIQENDQEEMSIFDSFEEDHLLNLIKADFLSE